MQELSQVLRSLAMLKLSQPLPAAPPAGGRSARRAGTPNRWVVLAVACLAVFTVLIASMIVSVLLPTFTRALDASTTDLLWIVDAFNLAFAALVLAAGSLSDRFGRKGALITGLLIYGFASGMAALAPSAGALVAWRALAGLGAAAVFPTTLSIIS